MGFFISTENHLSRSRRLPEMAKHNLDGARAEERIADYLKKNGYKILDKNWKTKWCRLYPAGSR